MRLNVYAVKDVKVAFMQPFFMVNDEQAIREFARAAMQENDPFAADKELWKLGEWEDQTGGIYGMNPEYMTNGKEARQYAESVQRIRPAEG
ncbi:VP5 [Gokushovirus WZ-2015a]|nr:VP5 [Gokushovirus WZ-2015a]